DAGDDVVDTQIAAVTDAAKTYVDFSIGEVEGAAKVIMPVAEQAATVSQYVMNPGQAVSDAGQAALRLATDQQYRDAAIAKAEAAGKTVLGAAELAAQGTKIATDLLTNPVQGVQEAASAAEAGAQKAGQVWDKVSAGYQDAAAKGEGARYVGNI